MLSDKETLWLSWTLTKKLVGCMLNITAHLRQHLKSAPSSFPPEVDQALLVSPSCSLSLFAALSQLTCHT